MPKSFKSGSVTYEINIIPSRLDVEGKPGRKMFRYSADYRVKGDMAWISILDDEGLPAYSDSDGQATLAAKAFIHTFSTEPSIFG